MGVTSIQLNDVPALSGNAFYMDYLSGSGSAQSFISFGPTEFDAALAARRDFKYPRKETSELLREYNTRIGAGEGTLANCDLLSDDETYCVITGQQVGFMGGPLYSLYKIITTIRLAEHLQENYPGNFVPVFWGATEDHDFHEINHAHYIKEDGEVGKIRFKWDGIGQPISNLELTSEVYAAYDRYLAMVGGEPSLMQLFEHSEYSDYSDWKMAIWLRLFADKGLVVVTPEAIRREAGNFMGSAFEHRTEIRTRIDQVAAHLKNCGYTAPLEAPEYGGLYTFQEKYRVRLDYPSTSAEFIANNPEQFSTDAALRPLLADSLLPTCASVLGPGEISYQAMLRPLYSLFDIPQPVLFPRQSYTVLEKKDQQVMKKYSSDIGEILQHVSVGELFKRVVPQEVIDDYQQIKPEQITIPPQASDRAIHHYREEQRIRAEKTQKLNEKQQTRHIKRAMKERGYSKGEIQRLRNRICPKNNMQERVLPMTHFLGHYGKQFVKCLFEAGDICDFSHKVITLDD